MHMPGSKAWSVIGSIMFLCAVGCERTDRQPAAENRLEAEQIEASDLARPRLAHDPTAKVPKPDAALIGYDDDSRTLVLYDLGDADAKWMLHLPDQMKGIPVNRVHQFLEDVDVDRVAVFYMTRSGQASPRITLRDVQAAQAMRELR